LLNINVKNIPAKKLSSSTVYQFYPLKSCVGRVAGRSHVVIFIQENPLLIQKYPTQQDRKVLKINIFPLIPKPTYKSCNHSGRLHTAVYF